VSSQLAPGSVARWSDGRLETWRYWDPDFGRRTSRRGRRGPRRRRNLALCWWTRAACACAPTCRSRPISPAGSTRASFAASPSRSSRPLNTFSWASRTLASTNAPSRTSGPPAGHAASLDLLQLTDIGELLPAVVRQAEQVLLRSAPAPLLRLSHLVRACDTKVVLTGEGSDEIFLGLRPLPRDPHPPVLGPPAGLAVPAGAAAPALPVFADESARSRALGAVLRNRARRSEEPGFSHLPRWTASARIVRFFSRGFAEDGRRGGSGARCWLSLPARVRGWKPLARAQYLEMQTLLAGYLSLQGDRMLMAIPWRPFSLPRPSADRFRRRAPERFKLRVCPRNGFSNASRGEVCRRPSCSGRSIRTALRPPGSSTGGMRLVGARAALARSDAESRVSTRRGGELVAKLSARASCTNRGGQPGAHGDCDHAAPPISSCRRRPCHSVTWTPWSWRQLELAVPPHWVFGARGAESGGAGCGQPRSAPLLWGTRRAA